MWVNTNEELVFQGTTGQMDAKAYLGKFGDGRQSFMTEDGGQRSKYYQFRIELIAGSYVFHNYGETGFNDPSRFAHKKNAMKEIRNIMEILRVREEKQ